MVATAVVATRPSAPFAESTPEGVVQRYLTAVFDRDGTTAVGFLEPGTTCTPEAVERTWVAENSSVQLVDAVIDGDSAKVRISVTYDNGDLFGTAPREQHSYRLVRSEGSWRIQGIPWPLYDCGVTVK